MSYKNIPATEFQPLPAAGKVQVIDMRTDAEAAHCFFDGEITL